ncbi:MAG: acyltransferase family protein [Synechococcaceae cyanobacterium]|jgi:peptidoglycan/LPS O-acetylase OafA/YrhL
MPSKAHALAANAAISANRPIAGGYRPEIDGLRAVAVLAVIVAHLHLPVLPSGFLGVDIFFVISGTVITASLGVKRSESFTEFLTRFYNRRCRRLLPALMVFLVTVGLLLCFFYPNPKAALLTGAAAFLGLSNLELLHSSTDYFAVSTDLNPFLHTWSLGVEEQFYFLYPLLLWCVGWTQQRNGAAKRLLILLSGLSLLSLALFFGLVGRQPSAAYFLMPARFWELGVGGLIVVLTPRINRYLPEHLSTVLATVSFLSLLALMALPVRLKLIPLTVLFTAVLIAVLPKTKSPRQWLSHRWLVALGLRSYSLYLWHWGVLAISRLTIGLTAWTLPFQLLLMLGLADCSYRWIESPIRRDPGRRPPSQQIVQALLLAGGGAGLFAAAGLRDLGARLYLGGNPIDPLADVAHSDPRSTISNKNCSQFGPTSLATCWLEPDSKTRPMLVLLGDSHAFHLMPLLGSLHRNDGFGVAAFSTGGIFHQPFPLLPFLRLGADPSTYRDTGKQIKSFWEDVSPRLQAGDSVILSSYLVRYFADQGKVSFLDNQGRAVSQPRAWQLWLTETSKLANTLMDQGVHLVVVLPVPTFNMPAGQWWNTTYRYPPEACSIQWFRHAVPEGCSLSIRRDVMLQRRVALVDDLEALKLRHPNVFLYDPLPFLCPPGQTLCKTHIGKQRTYGDDNHLSFQGSSMLYNDFLSFLANNNLRSKPAQSD